MKMATKVATYDSMKYFARCMASLNNETFVQQEVGKSLMTEEQATQLAELVENSKNYEEVTSEDIENIFKELSGGTPEEPAGGTPGESTENTEEATS